MAETRIYLKQQEAVTFRFNVIDKNTKQAISLSTAAGCSFTIKNSPYASVPTIAKVATGSTTDLAAGMVSCTFSQSDFDVPPGLYYGELYVDISATHKRKSPNILLDIRESIT